MNDPEYDRFGPWVVEISEADPPPRLFLPYLTREETPLLSIKIPRKIDRQKARPGMNLYDYVVNLYPEELSILQRVEDDVWAETFFYRDIQCLQYEQVLLRGNLRLVMPERVFDLPFNTVSEKIMRRLVVLIRWWYTSGMTQVAIAQTPDFADNNLSYYFANLLAREKMEQPDLRVWASQPETPVGAYELGNFRKLLFGVIDKRLLESLHLSDGRELKIINRGKTFKYRGQAVYGTHTFYLPLDKIIDVTWEPDLKNTAVVYLSLTVRGGQVKFAFVQDNASIAGYARFLAAVVGEDTAVSVTT